MHTLSKLIEQQQTKYSNQQKKDYLKNNSQFFTPINIALKMIQTIDIDKYCQENTLFILEPSAGFGILIISLVESIIQTKNCRKIKKIIIDAYETDQQISIMLEKNLDLLKHILEKDHNIVLEHRVINDNFILVNKDEWTIDNGGYKYDIIISNPPFDKINQSSAEAIIMKDIIYGQPNIYSLFIAMSLKLLKNDGTYVVLSPRNYLNGLYSIKLRNFILNGFTLTHLHSFEKRTVFNFVFQEIIITTYVNNRDSANNNNVTISYNGTPSFSTKLNSLISDKKTKSLILPKSKKDLIAFESFSQFKHSLEDINLKVSVGPVVQFRENYVSDNIYTLDSDYPLLVNVDILENNVIDYNGRQNIRKSHKKSISMDSKRLITNSNYVLVRKITAKNSSNLLIAAVLHKDFFDTDKIGLDNNLVYFHKLNGEELTIEEAYGIYCFISSSYFKEMYSLINGTHTINISDFNNIKFPSEQALTSMGKDIIQDNDFKEEKCNKIFEKYFIKPNIVKD